MESYNVDWQRVRERRLRADYRKLQELVQCSDLIAIERVMGDPPESYIIRYSCKGIESVGVMGPTYRTLHRVLIEMPLDYPNQMPRMRWLTPIFHPNINNGGTRVCIDTWYASKFLDDLCLMLGRMIQYQNYNPYNALRSDAADWSIQHAHLLPVDRQPLQRGSTEESQPDDIAIRFL